MIIEKFSNQITLTGLILNYIAYYRIIYLRLTIFGIYFSETENVLMESVSSKLLQG